MKDGKFEAEDIYLLLKDRFADGRQWLCAREVAATTGGGTRRLDFVAANCYEGQGFGIHAFEVKVSKSDLRKELSTPDKHNIFFDNVDYYSIVAPDYVLDKEYIDLIPKQWGIYRAIAGVDEIPNTLKVFRKPLALHDERDRMIRRGFAFSMIRAMGSIAAFKDQNRMNEMLKAAYDSGFSKGRTSMKHGIDYEKLYEEQRERTDQIYEALRTLGIRAYVCNDIVEDAKELKEKIDRDHALASAVRDLGYAAKHMRHAVSDYEKAIAPVLGSVSKETLNLY